MSGLSTTLTIGEFKARLPEALALVEKGQSVLVTYGRSKKPVAVLVPPPEEPSPDRVPGRFAGQFKVPDEVFFAPLSSEELAEWEGGPFPAHPKGAQSSA